jgi:copper chaperone
MATSIYTVIGMTCGHCEQAVTRELTKIDGVTGVDVTMAAGTVTVTSDDPIDEAAVRDAVEMAGYEMVG